MPLDELRRMADARGGVFTAADAYACGFSRSALRHRLASGHWGRIRRGLFTEMAPRRPAAGHDAVPELARIAAALAAVDSAAVASHHSAALVLGLATYGPRPAWVALTAARRASISCESLPWLRLRRSQLSEDDVWEVGGLPVTSPARTAVDLARAGSLRGGVVAMDAAMRAGASLTELERTIRLQRRWPGVRSARQALGVADAGSESALESLAHVCQHEAGLPRPRTQVRLYDDLGLIGRVDDFWPEYAIIGESDGLLKYTDAEALRAEKRRQERLEQRGLRVIRVTYGDVTVDSRRTAARYRAAFGLLDSAD